MKTTVSTDKSKLTKFELAFLIAAAVFTITIVSTCSPLYPFNPWDDTNCFFTVGRGITHGMVPYRDLYEQKGPLLYFMYALAALISNRSFIGAWIIECIAASLFAIFSWKTVKLFVEPEGFAITLIPLFLALTYTTRLFNFGGNAEELCFPMLTIALYFGLKSIVNCDGLPEKAEALICGIITAALFWIKYTLIGFMAGFCLYILVISIRQKNFSKLWALIWRFIAGFLILTVPILIYFMANGALYALWEAYFYNNIFLYHAGKPTGLASIPVIKNIYIPANALYTLSVKFPKFGIMMLLSVISVFFTGKKNLAKTLFLFVITFAFSAVIIFTRITAIYYYIYILAYCFGLLLIPVCKGINRIGKSFRDNPRFMQGLVAGLFIICCAVVLFLNKNTYLFLQKKDQLAQYRYAETINQTPDAKILTYDVMDAGFYTASGLLPQNRFFCYLNIETNYPAILEEQNRLIKEGYFDYIITTYFCKAEFDNYELVREEADPFVDYTGKKERYGFRLYKRK